jgi:hypothetical protein
MQRNLARAVLALVLGLGVLAGLIRAETPPPPMAADYSVQSHALQPIPSAEPYTASAADADYEGTPVRAGILHWHPVKDYFHNHPTICCWAHHNTLGCGSFHSDFNFIFGSCHTFYGEPCAKGPQPPPMPPGYGYGLPGYGPSPTSCRCP